MTRAKRTDLNQKPVVKQVRSLGDVDVFITSGVGDDFPDLILGFDKTNYLVEMKSPGGKPSPGQVEFHRRWLGQSGICYNIWDILIMLNYPRILQLFNFTDLSGIAEIFDGDELVKLQLMRLCSGIDNAVPDNKKFLEAEDGKLKLTIIAAGDVGTILRRWDLGGFVYSKMIDVSLCIESEKQ